MSLTDTQIWALAQKMRIPLVFCDFKDRLKKHKLQYQKVYIVNLENEFDEDGHPNEGSHYTAFQVNKYPNGKVEKCYFDPFGQPPPQAVLDFCGGKVPYNTKDIQSLMNSACGWYCLAWGHFINSWEGRSKDLYSDCEGFTSLFDDLDKSHDHKKNEFVLKHFFRSADEEERRKNPVDVFKAGDIKEGRGNEPLPNPETISTENDDYKTKL
jgi:hypothetical protein